MPRLLADNRGCSQLKFCNGCLEKDRPLDTALQEFQAQGGAHDVHGDGWKACSTADVQMTAPLLRVIPGRPEGFFE